MGTKSEQASSFPTFNNQNSLFILNKKQDLDFQRKMLIQSVEFDFRSQSFTSAKTGPNQACNFLY